MAMVDFRIKNLKAADGTRATLAEVTGSIDATSIVQFQNVMDKLVEKGVKNLILDCANVKYINSTGLGTLLKYVDTFESMDGHIAFTRVPSKVMLVMEMLGFNALFSIVPDEASALRSFTGKPVEPAVAPTPAVPAAQARSAPTIIIPASQLPAQARAAGPVIVKPSAQAPAAPRTPAQAGAPAAVVAGGYPASVECTRCGLTLDVAGAGKFKCPHCDTVLVADASGRLTFYAPRAARPVSVSLPSQPQLISGLGPLVQGTAAQMGFDDNTATRIGKAVTTASEGVVDLAYGEDRTALLHVIMIPDGDTLTIRISDYGKAIPAGGDGVPRDQRFALASQVMDSVSLKHNPKGGNLITLTKKQA